MHELQHRPDVLTPRERLEVHAGAEALSGTGYDTGREPRITVELLHGGPQALGQGPVDGVHGLGSIQRDDHHPTPALSEHRRLPIAAHLRSAYLGGIRMPPSTRMTSPFMYGLVSKSMTIKASSSEEPSRFGNNTDWPR